MIDGFTDYQNKARKYANYPNGSLKESIAYLGLGLAGESGEIANKLKKYLRGDFELTSEKILDLMDEIGDVLWYCSEICRTFNFPFEVPADRNIAKLEDRLQRNMIKGDGDKR